ncbi:MAG: UPF0149 family protein [Chlorobiaceae bacterium]|nr:UPF0149 family protein [Chlorobiaceae bacterium]NTV25681.1 UPF0149 family protein [Chlorobiaceae bacterium]
MNNNLPDNGVPGPLSGRELERLEIFLLEESGLKQSMNLEMLDGYLTALIVGPDTIMPSEWLPFVWDIYGEGQSPEFKNTEQASEIIGIMMRLMNSIIFTLDKTGDAYEPLPDLVEYPDDEERRRSVQSWCIGFLLGVDIREGAWDALFQDKETSIAVSAIEVVSGMFQDDQPFSEEDVDEIWSEVPDAVFDIRAFWLPYRQRGLDRMKARSGMVAGRNDPCPCGSGQKYKKCCGKAG